MVGRHAGGRLSRLADLSAIENQIGSNLRDRGGVRDRAEGDIGEEIAPVSWPGSAPVR